jgi:hypothetical protein
MTPHCPCHQDRVANPIDGRLGNRVQRSDDQAGQGGGGMPEGSFGSAADGEGDSLAARRPMYRCGAGKALVPDAGGEGRCAGRAGRGQGKGREPRKVRGKLQGT